MPRTFPITDVEKNIYGQLDTSRKIFDLIPKLTTIARHASSDDQLVLETVTKDLLTIGTKLSDEANELANNLSAYMSEEA